MGNRALAKKLDDSYYYYIYNGHGDVVMMVDEDGNTVNSYSYDSWGKITEQTETVENSIKYAGEYYDDETSFIYLRTRYYYRINCYQSHFISILIKQSFSLKHLKIQLSLEKV